MEVENGKRKDESEGERGGKPEKGKKIK